MKKASSSSSLSRRRLLLTMGKGSAAVVAMTLLPQKLWAGADSIDQAIKEAIGDAAPMEGRVELDLPQIAENGNTVPLGVNIDSPMTADDYVKAVHVFAAGNPQPGVASFYFSPACGQASCSTRMRLAKTQDVIAVAEMSSGEVYMAKTEVKVTIGGCGG